MIKHIKINSLIPLSVFTAAFLISMFQICSFDLFWHIKAGEYFINTWKILDYNRFSWTYPDHPWVSTYWLFEVFVYLIYHFSGFTGLILINGLINGLTYFLSAKFFLKKNKSFFSSDYIPCSH